jgi:DNA invertase Pin-like site-specific DNA recombinase
MEGDNIMGSQNNSSRVITNDNAADKTKVGYVRVSTVDQNESRQLEAFKDLSLYKMAKDTNRPKLKEMLDYVREGDTVYIKDFSRLARNTKDLLEITEGLSKRNIKLISLNDGFDTGTANGRLMLTLLAAVSTFEREILLERQREGIAIAKREGKFKGRKEIEKPVDWDEVYNLYANRRITATEAMTRLNLKRNTFYKMVSKMNTQ